MTLDVFRGRHKVYFGGSYTEHWSEDYKLTVTYADRRKVEAVYDGEKWIPAGGDRELMNELNAPGCQKITQMYFQAAATAHAAVEDCVKRGLPLERLDERFSSAGNPLVGPELMRILMDEHGMGMQVCYTVCTRCCGDMSARGVDNSRVSVLQPRTAALIVLLRKAAAGLITATHDMRRSEYRCPTGALRCGQELRLRVRILSGRIRRAFAIFWSDTDREELPMEQEGEWFACTFQTPETPMAMWYSFRLETADGSHWIQPDGSGYFGRMGDSESEGFRLTVYDKEFETPAWFRESVMYQIFPDRFAFSNDGTAERGIAYHKALGQTPELHKSIDEPVRWQPRAFERDYCPDDFYGGTFKGIESRLPYLKKLGVGCIYLNPIVEAKANHRYDTSRYDRPDPILGSMEDFERLSAEAEKLGIRIILDGVFSHTGADSVYFDLFGHYGGKGACSGKESRFFDWYDFRAFPYSYRCWWGFKDLPEVNEQNGQWQKDIITGERAIVKHWLRHGAAGWRLDVADELPDDVLELIRKEVKKCKPDAPIIGEVWEDAVIKESYGGRRSYALGRALDSVMNYPFRKAVLSFAKGESSAYELRDFLIGQRMNYPRPMYYALMNLLGTHDVERVRTSLATDVDIRSLSREQQIGLKIDEERLKEAVQLEKLCAAIQFSVPGVPSIYYGDEQGMCGVCDPFNRLPFREAEDSELHDWYAQLAATRNGAAALKTGEAVFMAENRDVLLILRYINGGRDAFGAPAQNEATLTVVNRGAATEFTADCSAAGRGEVRGRIPACTAEIIRL